MAVPAEPDMVGNVAVQSLRQTMERARTDPASAVVQVELEGNWNLDPGQPQFSSTLPTSQAGPVELKADFPPPLGGRGRAPSAVQYCLYAATACFLSTFALVAALEGVSFRRLSVRASARLNLSRLLDAGPAPVVEQLKWTVQADTDADDATLKRLLQLAEERCPAAWCLRNPVPFETEVARAGQV